MTKFITTLSLVVAIMVTNTFNFSTLAQSQHRTAASREVASEAKALEPMVIVPSTTRTVGSVAPGEKTTAYFRNLHGDVKITNANLLPDGTVPRELAGVKVKVANAFCHMTYVDPERAEFRIPYGPLPGSYQVEVSFPDGTTEIGTININVANLRAYEPSPAYDYANDGIAVTLATVQLQVVHSDGTSQVVKALDISTESRNKAGYKCLRFDLNRLQPNDQLFVAIYGSGFDNPVGRPAIVGSPVMIPRGVSPDYVQVGVVVWAGEQPGNAGVDQINVKLDIGAIRNNAKNGVPTPLTILSLIGNLPFALEFSK